MRVALYARASAADRDGETVEQILAVLATCAARRDWEIALECSDQGPFPEGRRDGRRRLLEAVRAKAVQGVVVRSLSHLARSLRHLSDLGRLFAVQDVALVATEDLIDTTDPGGAIRWRDWLEISGRLDRELRAEAAKLARLRTPGERWGRPAAAVNPLELLTWWEGRGGRRPLALRELARKLGVSEGTARKRLHALRAAGQVDDGARARALGAAGLGALSMTRPLPLPGSCSFRPPASEAPNRAFPPSPATCMRAGVVCDHGYERSACSAKVHRVWCPRAPRRRTDDERAARRSPRTDAAAG
ncbi:MAG TPA: recombinase family protein [Thermoanaerobaculia bacterium]|nr:recombinase family protein [Thermoanaerobaculia bacterium]